MMECCRNLASVAADRSESDLVRVAAVAALGDRLRSPMPRSIAALASADDRVADAVRLAEADRASRRLEVVGRRSSQRVGMNVAARGVRVAQIHLGAVLDPDLLHSGVGDTGGVATLLVRLGAALARIPDIAEVVTIGRGTVRDVLDKADQPLGGPRFAPVALEPEAGTAFGDPWPARISAERGLERVIRVDGRPDVIHLRMADVGSLAAADVAARSGIPTVFSLAPDPHGLISSREMSGDLDRRSFGADDARLHLWFRVHLVERLAREADHVALFPRERLIDQLRELIGIDVTSSPGRFTVVPEGIDVAQIRHAAMAGVPAHGVPGPTYRRAVREAEGEAGLMTGALGFLLDRVAALPAGRHGLPIVLSVGRLNELKGMARLAEVFASDPALRARATLVIVGGDLEDPTPTEATELARIRAAQAAQPDSRRASSCSVTSLMVRSRSCSLQPGTALAGRSARTAPMPARVAKRNSVWRSSRRWPPDSRWSRRCPAGRRPMSSKAGPAFWSTPAIGQRWRAAWQVLSISPVVPVVPNTPPRRSRRDMTSRAWRE